MSWVAKNVVAKIADLLQLVLISANGIGLTLFKDLARSVDLMRLTAKLDLGWELLAELVLIGTKLLLKFALISTKLSLISLALAIIFCKGCMYWLLELVIGAG